MTQHAESQLMLPAAYNGHERRVLFGENAYKGALMTHIPMKDLTDVLVDLPLQHVNIFDAFNMMVRPINEKKLRLVFRPMNKVTLKPRIILHYLMKYLDENNYNLLWLETPYGYHIDYHAHIKAKWKLKGAIS